MAKKLFCEISPLTYKISVLKNILLRKISDAFSGISFAKTKSLEKLPVVIYSHNSLIRRVLGNVDMTLQENKAVNLSIAAPKVNGIVINPGETFSFWHLVGKVKKSFGYKDGLTISGSETKAGVGGGMCQFTNLIHWMILHSPLEITEHHHHDGFDLFPDFGRQIPFGTGTSICYNYLDYRFKNTTDKPFQLIIYVTETHLCGELCTTEPLDVKYHIEARNEYFSRENGIVYRNGEVYRRCVDKASGNELFCHLIRKNHARVLYDTSGLEISKEE